MVRQFLFGILLLLGSCRSSDFVEGANVNRYAGAFGFLPPVARYGIGPNGSRSLPVISPPKQDISGSRTVNDYDIYDDNRPLFTSHQRPWSHPQQRSYYRADPLEDLTNHFMRKVDFVKRLPFQVLRSSVGQDYRRFGGCQYRPCLSVRHAIDTFLTKGLLG